MSVNVWKPTNLNTLDKAIFESESDYVLLAGCTDVLVDYYRHVEGKGNIIDLSGVSGLNGIHESESEVRIGAMTTFSEIAKNPSILKFAAGLAHASSMVGSPQIRNRGTIGGNVANNSPAADSIPCLIAMEAVLELRNATGETYDMAVEDFVRGGRESALEGGYIVAVRIPKNENVYSRFARIGSRSTVTISKLSLAIRLEKDADGTILKAGFGLGAVGRTARRSKSIEEYMIGKKCTEETILGVSEMLEADIKSSLAGRASMPYKSYVVTGLLKELFLNS